MGRPYATELAELDATYAWCLTAPVGDLARSVGRFAHHPLLAVGSGGSLTSAHYASLLHAAFTGQTSQTVTPFELAASPQPSAHSAVLICSAGGSNPDVIAAAAAAATRSPPYLSAITTREGSPLQEQLAASCWPQCHVFPTPTKKDGFLATNSLLATMVLLTRAYEQWAGGTSCLPESFAALIHPQGSRQDFLDRTRDEFAPLAARNTLIVLYGPMTKPAAMDVESRFTEAALANIQPADFRNFAHGRHYWLARHPATSGILAFAQPGDADVARRTLALIPNCVPRCQLSVGSGPAGAIAAVCHSLYFAQIAGEATGADPGRPHVPAFGRKLYHLRAMPCPHESADVAHERMGLALERKSGLGLQTLKLRGLMDIWSGHYTSFALRLKVARIRAVVIDYDGTLCGTQRRLTGLAPSIAKQINALLTAGVTIAIATGRGKSVRDALRKHVTSPKLRRKLIVGYHNGAEIGSLADEDCPPSASPLDASLQPIATLLRTNNVVAQHADVQAKGKQISLELRERGDLTTLYEEAFRLMRPHAAHGVSLTLSSHSVDILAAEVTKTAVVEYVVRLLRLPDSGSTTVLCIGDRGRWPGNDADLLQHPLSLSVDEVSDAPATCWNIAAPGKRFDLACLEYLERLKPTKSGHRFDMKGVAP